MEGARRRGAPNTLLVVALGCLLLAGCTVSRSGGSPVGEGDATTPGTWGPGSSAAPAIEAPDVTEVPSEAFASPADPAVVIDAPTAERVFRALYPLRTRAISASDAKSLRVIETGAALEYEAAVCRVHCWLQGPVGPDVPHTFSAPPQTGFPAFFVARANRLAMDGTPITDVVVFVRSDPSWPWLIGLTSATGGPNRILEHANAGLGRSVPSLSGPDPASFPALAAAYWQHWSDAGQAPPDTPIAVTPEMLERGAAIAQNSVGNAEAGRVETRRYDADPSVGPFVVHAVADQVLACGAVRFQVTYSPAPGRHELVQPPDRSTYGPLLAPGTYESIHVEGLDQSCFLAYDSTAAPFYAEPERTIVTGKQSA